MKMHTTFYSLEQLACHLPIKLQNLQLQNKERFHSDDEVMTLNWKWVQINNDNYYNNNNSINAHSQELFFIHNQKHIIQLWEIQVSNVSTFTGRDISELAAMWTSSSSSDTSMESS